MSAHEVTMDPAPQWQGVLRRKCACGKSATPGSSCGECAQKKKLQRMPASLAPVADETSLAISTSGGSVLRPHLRDHLEPLFGASFSGVRIHDDATAHATARALDAQAFTLGGHVHFGDGRYRPETREGMRLLAHELGHTLQQSGATLPSGGVTGIGAADSPEERQADAAADAVVAGRPVPQGGTSTAATVRLQRQPTSAPARAPVTAKNQAMLDGVPHEKWSEQVEAIYRRRGDACASAIANCRTRGAAACAWILTPAEVDRLHALSGKAKGDEKVIREELPKAAPVMGLLGPMGPIRPVPITIPPVVPPAVVPALAPAVAPALAPAVAPAAAPAAGTAAVVAAPVVMALYLAAAGVALFKLARFQAGLRAQGFTILEDALGTCIGGCHAPAAPKFKPRWDDLETLPLPKLDKPMDPETMRRWLEPTPSTTTAPTPQPAPRPTPRPIPKPDADFDDEDPKRRCRAMAVGQRGGNNCHDAFASMVSGSPREWGVETPEGEYVEFDGLGFGRMLFEVKTGYKFLLAEGKSNHPSIAETKQRFVEQSSKQSRVARRCGYSLLWVFNDKWVADAVSGLIEPPVTHRRFDCDIDA